MLLGWPWQFDRHVFHDGLKNSYTLEKDGKQFTLTPLTPQQLYKDQLRIQRNCEERDQNEKDKEENKSEKDKEENKSEKEKEREKESMNERDKRERK